MQTSQPTQQMLRIETELKVDAPENLNSAQLESGDWEALKILILRAVARWTHVYTNNIDSVTQELLSTHCRNVYVNDDIDVTKLNPEYEIAYIAYKNSEQLTTLLAALKERTKGIIIQSSFPEVFVQAASLLNGWKQIPFEGSNRLMLFELKHPLEEDKECIEQPLLTFVTRTGRRPKTLEIVQESLRNQTSQNYQQIIINDYIGKGMLFANDSIPCNAYRVKGRYVMILDDDRKLTDPKFVEDFAGWVTDDPEVVIIKCKLHSKTLPADSVWCKVPRYGTIDSSNIITRLDWFNEHIWRFTRRKGGDYSFINLVFHRQPQNIKWIDRIVSAAGGCHHGLPEGRHTFL